MAQPEASAGLGMRRAGQAIGRHLVGRCEAAGPAVALPEPDYHPGRLRLRGRRNRNPRPREEPRRKPGLAIGNRARNRLLRGLRFQGERGFALLTRCWTVLQHTTASPRNITQIARAALVLTNSGTTTSRELSEISDTRALLSSRVGVRNEGCAGRCGFR